MALGLLAVAMMVAAPVAGAPPATVMTLPPRKPQATRLPVPAAVPVADFRIPRDTDSQRFRDTGGDFNLRIAARAAVTVDTDGLSFSRRF